MSESTNDPSAANLSKAEELRRQAKNIVDELFKLATQAGYSIQRTTTYYDAIAQEANN